MQPVFLVENNYRFIHSEAKKMPQQKCHHCKHRSAKNTHRAQSHVKTCIAYQQAMKQKEEIRLFGLK